MSDLLNSASLVMIPSGYKEDTVYSQIPTDGSGDLSFTRASNGTRINSAGLVEVCPWNLASYSEEFTNAIYTPKNGTFTDNFAVAPNGTTTAAKWEATNSDPYIYQAYNGDNVSYTATCWVKATGTAIGKNCSIRIGGSAVFTAMTGEWQQLTITANINGSVNVGVEAPESATSGEIVYIWGFQLNIGSTAKPYFPTTDRLNVPRLTYQNGGGGCPSLLLEKQSTNLALYSEQFDNADWSKIGSTITANATISPDGTQNADKLIEDTSTGNHRIVNTAFAVNNGNAHSQSWYVKYFNNQWIQLNRGQEGSGYLNFDLINGVVGYTGGITDYQISNMANGWYRISINYVVTGTYATAGISILDTNVNARYESYVGDGTSGVYIWGCQYEQSSYPTSYIPTTSSSATRVADLSTSDTIQTAQTFAGDFTIFADFVPFIDSTDGSGMMILGGGASGLGATYQSYLWFVGSNVYLSGDGELNIIQRGYSMVVNQRVKIAFTRVGTTVKMFVNGAQVGASATSSTSITIRSIGWSYNLPTYQTKGKINQILLSASGASDTDAISLTTL
jgi:hypothetical protein